jgi:hypothetical protein
MKAPFCLSPLAPTGKPLSVAVMTARFASGAVAPGAIG